MDTPDLDTNRSQYDTSDFRAFCVLFSGLVFVVVALRLLDIPFFTRETLAWFFLIPIGAMLVASGIWFLASQLFKDHD